MSTTDSAVRLLRLLPVLSASSVLMFALDEHIFLGTWTHASLTTSATAHLPAWFTRWGRRGRWVILLGYPTTYLLALANLSIRRPELRMAGSEKWYWLGLMFSVGHIAVFGKGALKLLADIRNDVPKGKSTYSMGVWLRMNWIRALTTDLPAWVCFITAALKTL